MPLDAPAHRLDPDAFVVKEPEFFYIQDSLAAGRLAEAGGVVATASSV